MLRFDAGLFGTVWYNLIWYCLLQLSTLPMSITKFLVLTALPPTTMNRLTDPLSKGLKNT